MFPRGILLVLVGAIFAAGILQVSLTRLSPNEESLGCAAMTTAGDFDPTDTVAIWHNDVISPVLAYADTLSSPQTQVLGTSSDEKWIEIDLSDQKLIAHDGNGIFLESLISSGLYNRTPKGEYRIWYKIRSTKMEGGIKGQRGYYYLPNVPFDMFFKGSYGIHGTYWHNNFGQPMSHGCVNAPTVVAERLFYWTDPQLPAGKRAVTASDTNPGTRVVIHD